MTPVVKCYLIGPKHSCDDFARRNAAPGREFIYMSAIEKFYGLPPDIRIQHCGPIRKDDLRIFTLLKDRGFKPILNEVW